MKFDVYGRFRIDIVREGARWVVYRIQEGKRVHDDTIAIPAGLRPDEIAGYLDDVLHEWSRPGRKIRGLPY